MSRVAEYTHDGIGYTARLARDPESDPVIVADMITRSAGIDHIQRELDGDRLAANVRRMLALPLRDQIRQYVIVERPAIIEPGGQETKMPVSIASFGTVFDGDHVSRLQQRINGGLRNIRRRLSPQAGVDRVVRDEGGQPIRGLFEVAAMSWSDYAEAGGEIVRSRRALCGMMAVNAAGMSIERGNPGGETPIEYATRNCPDGNLEATLAEAAGMELLRTYSEELSLSGLRNRNRLTVHRAGIGAVLENSEAYLRRNNIDVTYK